MQLLTQSALLKALGWSLFNSLWQMSLLWAIYHLFILIFREAPARTRHGLAVLLLTAGTGWNALTFITAYWFSPATGAYLLTASFQAYGHRLQWISRWFADEGLSCCSFLYLLVLGGLLLHSANQYLRTRRITRAGLSKIAPEFRVFVTSTARNMGIIPAVKVHLSSLVDVPVTLGFLKPVILVPLSLATHLTPQQVEAILVHELAHIRRKDYLINLGVTVIELLFFFNPFARMLIRQLKKEREHCCDDLVLQFRYEPHAYVSALLSLARQHRHGRLAVAATGAGGNQLLLQRARKILQQKRMDERPGARSLCLLFLTILVTTVLFLGLSRPIHPPRLVSGTGTHSSYGAPLTTETRTILRSSGYPYTENHTRPIVNNIAINTKPHPSLTAASQPASARVTHRTILHARIPGENEIYLLKTAGPGTITRPVSPLGPTYAADLVIVDDRDYSIGGAANDQKTPPAPSPMNEAYPFVPQSSFSFQYTDTLPPEDRLAMMQLYTEKAIRTQIGQLKRELNQRLDLLRQEQSTLNKATAKVANSAAVAHRARSAGASQNRLKQLFREQLQLQQHYLIRLDSLQRQLERAVHHLTTVYI